MQQGPPDNLNSTRETLTMTTFTTIRTALSSTGEKV